jgi:ribosomal-protein-alanine N-acetyltransferase
MAHAAVMAALHGAAFPHEPWDEASFATLLGQPGVVGLLDPRGGILLLRVAADEAEILTIGVAVKRRGIGRGLMEAGFARAQAMGAAVMHLDVAADNAAALGLYGALGFVEVGRRRGYYGGGRDAILLTRQLLNLRAD